MSRCRFLYLNEITASSQIVVSSSFFGVIGGIYAEQLGSAVAKTSGVYSGAEDKGFVVEIDSVAAGNAIGQATFKWSDSDGSVWNETGVLTQTGPYLMSDGVAIQFASGSGNDFEVGDKWSWLCNNNYSKQNLFDLDRNSEFRLRSPNSSNITIDLGTSKNILAFLMMDHNLSQSATITLMGNNSDAWDAPAYSKVIQWNAQNIGMYLYETYQYWRLQISDMANADGYIEIGELYLGGYLELSINYGYGWIQKTTDHQTVQISKAGVERASLNYQQESFQLPFKSLTKTDIEAIVLMFETIKNKSTRGKSLFYLNISSDDPNNFLLVRKSSAFSRTNTYFNRYNATLQLAEVTKSNV